MINPLAALNLHCVYRSGTPLCPACRKRIFFEAGIARDFYAYGKHKIMRLIYFYSKMYDEIRMIWGQAAPTLIGEESYSLVVLRDAGIFDPISKSNDKYPDPDQFQDAVEELYTFEQFLLNAAAVTEFRQRKRKALF
jgi:hypothetical protein